MQDGCAAPPNIAPQKRKALTCSSAGAKGRAAKQQKLQASVPSGSTNLLFTYGFPKMDEGKSRAAIQKKLLENMGSSSSAKSKSLRTDFKLPGATTGTPTLRGNPYKDTGKQQPLSLKSLQPSDDQFMDRLRMQKKPQPEHKKPNVALKPKERAWIKLNAPKNNNGMTDHTYDAAKTPLVKGWREEKLRKDITNHDVIRNITRGMHSAETINASKRDKKHERN